MTWHYTGDPESSPKDEVRFLIQDTDKCDPLLQDGEINFVLKRYNYAPINAAIRCCEILIAKFSRQVDESVGQVHVTFSQRVKQYQQLKIELQNRLTTESMTIYAGGVSRTDQNIIASNTDRVRPAFTRYMMNNGQTSAWVNGTWNWGYPGPGGWWW